MEEMTDRVKGEGLLSKGYGIIPKLVMVDDDLSIEAKAIYAYIASYAGNGDSAFPSVKKICYDLGISDDRFHKHKKPLLEKGYIEIKQERKGGGKFASNVYFIKQFVQPTPCFTGTDNPTSDKPAPDNPTPENQVTNNNSSINNSITNNNNNKKDTPPKSKKRIYETDSIYYQLASELFEKIKTNNPEAIEPNLQTWSDDIRKMIEIDGRKPEQVSNMINWCQSHDFWSGVILSAKKIRDKYDQMRTQALNDRKPTNKKSYNNSSIRKENLPEWYGKPEVIEKTMDAAAQAEMKAKLEKIRAFGK